MNIIWHGQSCFEIIATPAKNSQVRIVIDPFSEEIGLRVPKLEADILLVSHSHHDHNNVKRVSGNPFLISGPGEYEIKNVFIQGIASLLAEPSPHLPPRPALRSSAHEDKKGGERGENTIYTIEAEDLKLCHLGDLGQKELTEEQLEKIGEVDILMIPVGGVYTISAKEALKIMSQIEPKITIPMHYQMPERKRRAGDETKFQRPPKLRLKLEGLDKFLKSLGIKKLEPLPKLSIKKRDISPEEAKIIILKP